MSKIFLFFAFVLIISNCSACSVQTPNPIGKDPCILSVGRMATTNEDYLNFMKTVDWNLLKSKNVTLSISGEKFELMPEFIKKMEQFH